ncbi:MAG TPA: radical SAM protein [Acidobacteriaceae bacterium]|nr:radical SAM protein [Acidobacteriaceae bacterium]
MSLLLELNEKATALGVPLGAHLDITWRCNERCVHCYLDHDQKGEMTTDEIRGVLRQLADSGTLFLAISGGEPLLRRDCFEILEYARSLRFNVKLKTNAVMIGEEQAARIRQLGIEQVQISVYSHLPEIHDAITKLPGSLRRTTEAIRRLRAHGVRVSITNVLMKHNYGNARGVKRLAEELGVQFVIDPTITPMLSGDRSIMSLGISGAQLEEVLHTEEFVGDVNEYCAPVSSAEEDVLDGYSCSAGHTLAYISPFGDVFPCVAFPMPCGNLRQQSFREIWWHSPALTELRSVRVRDLHTCSHCGHNSYCSRCPGLAYMEGDYRGPSSPDCEKSYARTGIPSAAQLRSGTHAPRAATGLVQIQGLQ